MTEYKNGGKYSKGLYVGIRKSEEHQQEEIEELLKSQLLILVTVHNPLKNMVIAGEC